MRVSRGKADCILVQAPDSLRIGHPCNGLQCKVGRDRRAWENVEQDADRHEASQKCEVYPMGDLPVLGSHPGDSAVGERDGYLNAEDGEVE